MPIQLTDRDIDYLTAIVATEADPRVAQTSPQQYELQVRGVIDTVLNRMESDQFPDTVAGVGNQYAQFSAINGPKSDKYEVYGSVDKVPASKIPDGLRETVKDWVVARQSGAPSSVGGNLNYANIQQSQKQGWLKDLDGPLYGTAGMAHQHGTAQGLTPIEANMFHPLPSDEILAMAGLSSYGPTGIPSSMADNTGRMPSSAELAQFFGPLPSPAPLSVPPPLDMQLARDGGVPSSIMPSLNSRSPDMPVFNAAYDPRIGAMVPIPPTQHLGSAVLGSPYPQGMEQDRGLQAALAAQIAPPPSSFAPNPVATVPINPATGMPQGSYNDTGSMPSFASLANFATGAPANSPSTSVAQMYGGMLPPAPVSAPRADTVGSMPSMADLGSFISNGPSIMNASTVYVRPDGTEYSVPQAGSSAMPPGVRPDVPVIQQPRDSTSWLPPAPTPVAAPAAPRSSWLPSQVPAPAPSAPRLPSAPIAAPIAKPTQQQLAQQVINSPYGRMMAAAATVKATPVAPRPVAAPLPPLPRARPANIDMFQATIAAPRGAQISPAGYNGGGGTFAGSSTGRSYNVGQEYAGTNGYLYIARPDGTFQQAGQAPGYQGMSPSEQYDAANAGGGSYDAGSNQYIGSSTGTAYEVGQTYSNGNGTYLATPDGFVRQ